jgi:hypothetical protein
MNDLADSRRGVLDLVLSELNPIKVVTEFGSELDPRHSQPEWLI